jgi:hypothetical protein
MIGDMETERVEALRRYAVLDTPCEREFGELAAQICGTPLAAIGLMDAEREWFKATVGMSVTEVPRATSLSAETMLGTGKLAGRNAFIDWRELSVRQQRFRVSFASVLSTYRPTSFPE